jgi:hypothetical protein
MNECPQCGSVDIDRYILPDEKGRYWCSMYAAQEFECKKCGHKWSISEQLD